MRQHAQREVGSVTPELSVVVPVFDEQDNVLPLIKEIVDALAPRLKFEIIFVDDCSSDRTLDVLKSAKAEFEQLRVIGHDRNYGQSSAIRSGVLAARGELIATLDGDGQNDPADLPLLVDTYRKRAQDGPIGMVSGRRVGRRDSWMKQKASFIGNGIRRFFLRDKAVDTGCSLKVFARELFLRLPYFDHMHRYLAALVLREGLAVDFVNVSHRSRLHGSSKYGILDRAFVSISDLAGVLWLRRRGSIAKNTQEF